MRKVVISTQYLKSAADSWQCLFAIDGLAMLRPWKSPSPNAAGALIRTVSTLYPGTALAAFSENRTAIAHFGTNAVSSAFG